MFKNDEMDFELATVKLIGKEKFKIEGVEFIDSKNLSVDSLNDADLILIADDEHLKKISELERKSESLIIALVEDEKIISDVNIDSYMVVKNKSSAEKIIQAIANLIAVPGLVNLDFSDVENTFKNSGKIIYKFGESSGKNAVVNAIKAAIDSSLKGAKGILLNILGASDSLSMMEVNEASTTIQEACHEDAEIIWGISVDDELEDKIYVTIIATKF